MKNEVHVTPMMWYEPWFYKKKNYCWDVFTVRMNPIIAIELLFFAIFGQTSHEQFIRVGKEQPQWTTSLFKLTFGVYMLVSVVVLINLLIAMMSDTYQRIQAQSDIEWKYGLSKLIRNMHRWDKQHATHVLFISILNLSLHVTTTNTPRDCNYTTLFLLFNSCHLRLVS